MEKLILIVFLSGVLWMHLMFLLGIVSNEEEPPGLMKGKLSGCSGKSNCACSEFEDDKTHYVTPVSIPQHIDIDLRQVLREAIKELKGQIQIETESYIAATFSSPFFRFVDDFAIRIDRDRNVIHLRAASRVGYSDTGANRNRIQLFKDRIAKAVYIKSVFGRSVSHNNRSSPADMDNHSKSQGSS